MFPASRPGAEGQATSRWAPGRSAEWQSWNESVVAELGSWPATRDKVCPQLQAVHPHLGKCFLSFEKSRRFAGVAAGLWLGRPVWEAPGPLPGREQPQSCLDGQVPGHTW